MPTVTPTAPCGHDLCLSVCQHPDYTDAHIKPGNVPHINDHLNRTPHDHGVR